MMSRLGLITQGGSLETLGVWVTGRGLTKELLQQVIGIFFMRVVNNVEGRFKVLTIPTTYFVSSLCLGS